MEIGSMKISIILIFSVILLVQTLAENSYGQISGANSTDNSTKLSGAAGPAGPAGLPITGAQKAQAVTEIFIQMRLYNSAGQLIAYIEGKPQQIFNLDKVIDWLEPISQKSTITRGGERFELLQFNGMSSFSKDESMGGYFLNQPVDGRMVQVLHFYHDSYRVLPGDILEVFWTAIRPSR